MAKIIKTPGQIEALKKIKDNVRLIRQIDAVLTEAEDVGTITVQYGNKKVTLAADESYKSGLLATARKDIVKATKNLANKNAILLDQDDHDILAGLYPQRIAVEEEEENAY